MLDRLSTRLGVGHNHDETWPRAGTACRRRKHVVEELHSRLPDA
jgi:hypothetical protein